MLGIVLILARLVNISRDIANVIPIGIRLMRYVSGVFFSIDHYASGAAQVILAYQPFALMLTTARESLMQEYPVDWTHWVAAAIWAVVLIVIGMIVFWRDEARYGRG
jgi:teichoic acid transport system permease protein